MSQDDIQLLEMLEPHWFRVSARHWAVSSGYNDDAFYTQSELIVEELRVEKHTPKGAWLSLGFGNKKLVLREYQHRGRAYAAPTLAIAMEDFRKRKQFRIRRLQSQINLAQKEIDMLDRGQLRTLTYNQPF